VTAIERDLLNAANEIFTAYVDPEDSIDVSPAYLSALIAELSEGVDGCDHSVGICMCAEVAIIDELHLRLDGKMTCRVCGGDGVTYREEHTARCATLTAEGYECHDEHLFRCPTTEPFAVLTKEMT
jgi:hypothetical protein